MTTTSDSFELSKKFKALKDSLSTMKNKYLLIIYK